MPSAKYIAYIDEAGDFGLRSIAPKDPNGASEWFVLAAVVIRSENEPHIAKWLADIRYAAKNLQPTNLHFRKLSLGQKKMVCEMTSELPVRLFVYISHKPNMQNYKNKRAERVSQTKHWFYWFASRILMERVTDFCHRRNITDKTPGGRLRVEFSRRKDLMYSDFRDYFTRMWAKEEMILNKREVNWSVFNIDDVQIYDHAFRAGLQFADIAASAFYQAVNPTPKRPADSEFAKLLGPRMQRVSSSVFDEGLVLFPTNHKIVGVDETQKEVFYYYGCPRNRFA